MPGHDRRRIEQRMQDLMDRADYVVDTKEPGCPEHKDLLDDIERIAEREGFNQIGEYREWIDIHESLALRYTKTGASADVDRIGEDTWKVTHPQAEESYRIYRRSERQWEIDEMGGRFYIDDASSFDDAVEKATQYLTAN